MPAPLITTPAAKPCFLWKKYPTTTIAGIVLRLNPIPENYILANIIYLFIYLLSTSVDTEMCCPKGKFGCQYTGNFI
jgi:hypothetical protein